MPVDGGIGIRANALPGFHAGPADRIIVSTALEGYRLLTADDGILRWSGNLNRLDARE
ncbi:MAG: type II toxin-antitoxin system VapC family toxin [Caldilineaceae bacterium SB0661_bin_34]|nr:type II toxin-antitoxin system VapC family toxin [Caldilineaceae bacterium SB0661_bin_34]